MPGDLGIGDDFSDFYGMLNPFMLCLDLLLDDLFL